MPSISESLTLNFKPVGAISYLEAERNERVGDGNVAAL